MHIYLLSVKPLRRLELCAIDHGVTQVYKKKETMTQANGAKLEAFKKDEGSKDTTVSWASHTRGTRTPMGCGRGCGF